MAIKDVLGDQLGIASSYHQLGIMAGERGDLAVAKDWYQRSLAIREALDDRPGVAASYHQLGMAAQLRGDQEAAEDWYRRSLAIQEALSNRPGMATTYGQLGLLSLERGDAATALAWTLRANTQFPDFPSPLTAHAPTILAALAVVLGLTPVEAEWQRVSGALMPSAVRTTLTALMERAKANDRKFVDAVTAQLCRKPAPAPG